MPFRCFAHIINLASKDMIKAAENIGLNQIVKLRNIIHNVNFLKIESYKLILASHIKGV